MTPAEIRAFQDAYGGPNKPFDWNGVPLLVDGDLGPKTRWAMDLSRQEPLRQAIVLRAVSCLGMAEPDGNNRTEFFDFLNERCGVALGSPYCASGASWCISVPGAPEVAEAGAQELLRTLRRTTLVQPGDVGGAPTGKRTGHVGIVVAQGPGEVAMVEFNHGNRVALVRRLMQGLTFGTNMPALAMPGIPPGLPLVPWSYEGTR